MKLRELINKLEELSENGKNDNMKVVYDNPYYLTPVTAVFINSDSNEIEIQ